MRVTFMRSKALRAIFNSCSSKNSLPMIATSHICSNQKYNLRGNSSVPSSKLFSSSVISRQTEKLLSINNENIGGDGIVKTITMNSPKTRNSLSLDMIENLIENIHDQANDGLCRCIVIKGEGKAFSAGHNLKEMTTKEGTEYHTKIFERCNVLMDTIMQCPIPVIAVVNGVAAAAGCQLVAMCDIAIATKSSR